MCACEQVDYLYEPKLVIEGLIENNGYPIVKLTYSADFFSSVDSSSLNEYVNKIARVEVIQDDSLSEVLTLSVNKKQFPKYIYQGNELIGQLGLSYDLLITYNDKEYRTKANILPPPKIDSIYFESVSDSQRQIKCVLSDISNEINYYRVFTKVLGEDSLFVPVFGFSTFSDELFNGGPFNFIIERGLNSNAYLEGVSTYFGMDDQVKIKIVSINKEAFDFWKAYDRELLNYVNPFAASNSNLPSNISGALGIWYGQSAIEILKK